jgi:multisubunit Na+/H+ antiporter MnhE subunit
VRVGHVMNTGSITAILFGTGFVVAGWALYKMAKRASADRRFFRLGAYSQMVVFFFAGITFIVLGVLTW